MAIKSGFFNAVVNNGKADREYNSEDINNFFEGILTEGVFRAVGNALLVGAGARGLTVTVETGRAMVKNHWFKNDAIVTLTINPAHAIYNRYTSVILRYSKADRTVELTTLDGVVNDMPAIPTLTQDESVYEIALAHIYITAGATSITSANVTDARTYVGGLVDPVPFNFRRFTTKVSDYQTQSYFDVPLSYNLTLMTTLLVYSNGILCDNSLYELQVNEVEGNYMVVFNEARVNGAVIDIIMIN